VTEVDATGRTVMPVAPGGWRYTVQAAIDPDEVVAFLAMQAARRRSTSALR
jgi:hypothetical protein